MQQSNIQQARCNRPHAASRPPRARARLGVGERRRDGPEEKGEVLAVGKRRARAAVRDLRDACAAAKGSGRKLPCGSFRGAPAKFPPRRIAVRSDGRSARARPPAIACAMRACAGASSGEGAQRAAAQCSALYSCRHVGSPAAAVTAATASQTTSQPPPITPTISRAAGCARRDVPRVGRFTLSQSRNGVARTDGGSALRSSVLWAQRCVHAARRIAARPPIG